MKVYNLNDFTKGWFIGDFNPSLFKTSDFEIGIKRYELGQRELSHHHKISTEYTVIISGEVLMNGEVYTENDVIIMEPNEDTDFEALTNAVTLVVKTPSVPNDKFLTKI